MVNLKIQYEFFKCFEDKLVSAQQRESQGAETVKSILCRQLKIIHHDASGGLYYL